MDMLALVLALSAAGTCYMVDGEGQYIDLNNGLMCPEITAITQPTSTPPLSVPEFSPANDLTPEERFIDGIILVTPQNTPLFDAIFSDALDPLAQGQRICSGQSFNEAKPASLTPDEFAQYRATVEVIARDRLCP